MPSLRLVVRCLPIAGVVLAVELTPVRAKACGVSAAGVSTCSLAEHEEATRPHWVVGASGVATSTRLSFDGGDVHADETRYAAFALLAYLPTRSLVLEAGAGATFGGSLRPPDGRHDFLPGPVFSLGADWRALDDGRFFVVGTSLVSFSAARTQKDDEDAVGYQALDVRLGGQAGIDVFDVLRPYALARVFGGPVFWRYQGKAVTGTDTHHYQLGIGLAVRPVEPLSVFAEGVPLGERALSLGVAVAF